MLGSRPLIISEIGINFGYMKDGELIADFDLAKDMAREAGRNGADIVKFQLYSPEKIFPDNPELLKEAKKFEITKEMWEELVEVIRSTNKKPMASVFDIERMHWCRELEIPYYKIASRSVEDTNLCNTVLDLERPTFISLGMWDYLSKGLPYAQPNAIYLECVSKYPSYADDVKKLRFEYNRRLIGYSDHVVGMSAAYYAIANGAQVIEKHYTHDKDEQGSDHACSMDRKDLIDLHRFIDDVNTIRGGQSVPNLPKVR
jgi:N,N'-diacetyllegionaminate synthase